MTRKPAALAAALALLATSTLSAPALAGDAVSKAALAACRAAAREQPADFDGLVRVTTCQRATAIRLRHQMAQARAASVVTARTGAQDPVKIPAAGRR